MGVPQPAFYILKCQQSSPPNMPKPSCVTPQSQDLFQYMAQALMQKGIMATVQPIQTSCLGRCNVGPVMLVEPGHHMYVGLTKEKVDRIIDEHIMGGDVVSEYLIPEDLWDSAISPTEMAAQMA